MAGPASSKKSGRRSASKTSVDAVRRRAEEVAARLTVSYPDAECELIHRNPYELTAATILSAQCTDVRVNMV
ncbi:MAG: endonuclease III, partial [Actinomycetota bacterium]